MSIVVVPEKFWSSVDTESVKLPGTEQQNNMGTVAMERTAAENPKIVIMYCEQITFCEILFLVTMVVNNFLLNQKH